MWLCCVQLRMFLYKNCLLLSLLCQYCTRLVLGVRVLIKVRRTVAHLSNKQKRAIHDKASRPKAKEGVHDGHVGGPKQYNDFPLGNILYFYANIFYCFSPPTWLPCTHSMDYKQDLIFLKDSKTSDPRARAKIASCEERRRAEETSSARCVSRAWHL